jgi:Co/Zn/Cd efflux system component
MTITFSVFLLFVPLMGPVGYRLVDTLLTPVIAASMCYVGWMWAKPLSGMLVMSYSGPDLIGEVERQIRAQPLVTSVSDISLWQVDHSLWLASMRLVINGNDIDEARLRQRAAAIVKEILADDGANERWETTVDIKRTTLD